MFLEFQTSAPSAAAVRDETGRGVVALGFHGASTIADVPPRVPRGVPIVIGIALSLQSLQSNETAGQSVCKVALLNSKIKRYSAFNPKVQGSNP